MVAKTFLLCISALAVQTITAQYIGSACNNIAATNSLAWEAAAGPMGAAPCNTAWNGAGISVASPYNGAYSAGEYISGYSPAALAASNGGGFIVSSASPIAPNGVSMASENAYDGAVSVTGAVPFLSAVALEGALPTAGAGAVTYGCGNGNVAILSEDIGSAGYGYAGSKGYGAGIAGPAYNGFAGPIGYEAAIAGPAYGCNGIASRSYGGCGCGCGCGAY